MANSLDDMMMQMANQAYQLDNARLGQLQKGQIGDSLPGVRSFADVWQAINMVRDTMNGLRDNKRLKEKQDYLDGKINNNNNNNMTTPAVSPTGGINPFNYQPQSNEYNWAVGQTDTGNTNQGFGSFFGNNKLINNKPLYSVGENPYSFTKPTSEQAQRSVGEVPQSATLGNGMNLRNYNPQQPQVTQQVQQQQQPQGNVNYLDDAYALHNWVQNNGGGRPNLDIMRYAMNYAPLVRSAREQRIRDNIAVWENPNSTPEQKQQARIQIASDTGQLDLGFDLDNKRRKADLEEQRFMATQGYELNPEYDENVSDSIGNSIVSTALNNYKEGEQWMSPDGTGDSRTQCSNWVSDVLKRSGVKGLGHANGDELMKQAGKAYRTGLQGIQPGDVLNFKDHVGFYIGNGQYMARNSSGGVHRGSMEEAIQYFGQPLGYISMSQYTGNTRGQKYRINPNYVSDREKLERQLANDRWREALANAREERAQARDDRRYALELAKYKAKYIDGVTGKTKANPLEIDLPADLQRNIMVSLERFKNSSAKVKDTDDKISSKIGDDVAGAYAPLYKYLINNGINESDAKNFMFKHITSELGKDYNKTVSNESIWDIIDQASELYNRNTPAEQFSEFSRRRKYETENKKLNAKDLQKIGLGYVPQFDKNKMDKYVTKDQMINSYINHYYNNELGPNKWDILGD